MRHPNDHPAAPNYTNACIVMFGVNLAWMLFLVWAVWGLLTAAAASWLLARVIDRIEDRRNG